MKPAIVVVSHYNAWPPDQLIALLDQIHSVPAHYPFRVRVVVNQAEARALELPSRLSDVDVHYRENRGYNIGAWDFGWRLGDAAPYYMFLQEECIIQREGWLNAFVQVASRPTTGLVGESLILWSTTWQDIDEHRDRTARPPLEVFGRPLPWSQAVRCFLDTHGIPPGEFADHLQSLILCTRREVLEQIGGFRSGDNYDEAVCSEIAISKYVQAIGLRVRQVGFRPFTYVRHPQWDADRAASGTLTWQLRRAVNVVLPRWARLYLRRLKPKPGAYTSLCGSCVSWCQSLLPSFGC
jgi:hypothetical protein